MTYSKRFFFAFVLYFFLTATNCYSQSILELYGKPYFRNSLIIGIDGGIITRNTLWLNDFKNENTNIGYGISLTKPLNKWLSLEGVMRWGKNLSGKITKADSTRSYVTERPLDIYASILITPIHIKGVELGFSGGFGTVNFKANTSTSGGTWNKDATYELIVPIAASVKKHLWKKLDMGIGYRYYFLFVDNLDAFKSNNDFDKYSYTFFSLYYNSNKTSNHIFSITRCPRMN